MDANGIPLSKSALKNLKRKEKMEERANSLANAPDDWDSDEAAKSKEPQASKEETRKKDEDEDVNAVTSKLDKIGL